MRLVPRFAMLVTACLIGSGVGQQNLASDREALRSAAHVFSGTVRSIAHQRGAVLVVVHIEEAIKGTSSGTEFQWREWEGAWRSGARYRAGERLIVFLRQPGATGLTSPLKVLKVQADKVQMQRRSPRLGARQAAVAYSEYMRALRTLQ